MHVVHLYDGHEKIYGGKGSVPGVVWNVAKESAARGHDVTVVERRWRGLDARAEHEGVSFRRLDLSTGADEPWERVPYESVTSPAGTARLVVDRTNFALQSLRWLRGSEYDALHVHLPFAATVVATVAPGSTERMVYTAHLGELRLDALTSEQRGGGRLAAPEFLSAFSPDVYLAKRAAETTVLNGRIKGLLERQGVPAESVTVVPNGVDVERFASVTREAVQRVRDRYGLGDAPTLLFVGTVMPRKGVDVLVRAAGALASQFDREFDLVVAGEDELDGGYVAEVRGIAREEGVADRVSFPGFVPAADLPALYAAADVFVMPSREEGFGMTVIEALAAGTPVVGTRVGAIPDLVDEGVHGSVVDPDDPRALADAVDRVLGEIVDTDDVISVTRQRAEQYSWQSVGQQFEAVYREVTT